MFMLESARYGTVLLVTLPSLYLLYKTFTSYWKWKKIANVILRLPGDYPHWLYGSIAEYPGPNEIGIRMAREDVAKYPRLVQMWIGPVRYSVNVRHPDTVRDILKSSEPKSLGIGGYTFLHPWLGDGLLISGGKKWARNRRLLTPAFHFDILKPYMSINNRCMDTFLGLLEPYADSGDSFEVFKYISHLTLDIVLRCAFSYETDCQQKGERHPYVKAITNICETIVNRFLNPLMYIDPVFYLTYSGRKFKQHCDYVHTISEEIMEKRKGVLAKEGSSAFRSDRYLDFLDILLTAKDEDNVGLSDIQIRNEVDTFLFEGHDTTASGISWTLYALASNPKIQKKCQEEVDQVLEGRDNHDVEWADLGKLKYLTQCIKEALRLYTPVPFLERSLTKDLNINGYNIPQGSTIDIDLYCLHHNPLIWEGSMAYDPDRFSPEQIDQIDIYAFVPFSAGPRNCIGQNFALHEMKVVIARIIRNYELTIDAAKQCRMKMVLVNKTEDGMFLRAKKRHPSS